MLGLGKTGTVRAPDADGSARSQDIYQRYAAARYRQALYRQALLTPDNSAWAENVVCDVIVNESALALMPEPGEHDERYRLAEFSPRDMASLLRAALHKLTLRKLTLRNLTLRNLAPASARAVDDGNQL